MTVITCDRSRRIQLPDCAVSVAPDPSVECIARNQLEYRTGFFALQLELVEIAINLIGHRIEFVEEFVLARIEQIRAGQTRLQLLAKTLLTNISRSQDSVGAITVDDLAFHDDGFQRFAF